jgi:hypothetical protein
MSEYFQFRVELLDGPPMQLLLYPSQPPNSASLFTLLTAWLKQTAQFSQIQAEQGADWIKIRFYFQAQPFYLNFVHYGDCYWIDADSHASHVLLSPLAEFIASIECNHGLSRI